MKKYCWVMVYAIILSCFLNFEANSATCFLPDCQLENKRMTFLPMGAEECYFDGYLEVSSLNCSPYSVLEFCIYNESYGRCNDERWCLENGFAEVECEIPEYLTDQCPNGLEYYYSCEENVEKACQDLNPEYVSECPSGYQLDIDTACPYSEDYAKCCNSCVGYDYLLSEIETGYVAGESCDGCNGVTKYKRELNPCNGYQSCSNGGKDGSATCKHGTETWYASCCDSSYQYTCSGGGYLTGSGDSCSGKYKSCICAAQYKWEDGSCEYCGDSYKYDCNVGGNITGGRGNSCGGKYTACECSEGQEWNSVTGNCGSSCGSEYQYSCDGEGEQGSGTACDGKYTLCVCTSNYVSFCGVTFCN